MTEKEFCEKHVKYMCENPKLTQNGTFFEVAAYLEGFAPGAPVDVYAHSFSTPFFSWLRRDKFNLEEMDWNKFRALFTSDNEALKNLSVLYKEYTESLELDAS